MEERMESSMTDSMDTSHGTAEYGSMGGSETTLLFTNLGPPEIPLSEIHYKEKDLVGVGSFGAVYRGSCRNLTVAVKVPIKELNEDKLQIFRDEVKTMRQINHTKVVLFLGAHTEGKTIKIVTEFCKTDVQKLLDDGILKIPLNIRLLMAKDAALGMSWIHGINSMVHRDLKPANLLVSSDGTVKIADFGFGKVFKAGTSFIAQRKGSLLYMAPEVIHQEVTDQRSDIYSFSIILWQLITGKDPLGNIPLKGTKEEAEAFAAAVYYNHYRPQLNDSIPKRLYMLISTCWHPNYYQRPYFKGVIEQLNFAIIEQSIDNEAGQTFWRQNFVTDKKDMLKVPWEVFKEKLEIALDYSDFDKMNIPTSPGCLEPFLCYKMRVPTLEKILRKETVQKIVPCTPIENTNYVTMESFNLALKFFGPFVSKVYSRQIFGTVYRLTQQPWFHGYIELETANSRLERRTVGTFLLRLSTSKRFHPFTLSYREWSRENKCSQPKHHRICILPDRKYKISFKKQDHGPFDTIEKLIEACRPLLNLKQACPKMIRDIYED